MGETVREKERKGLGLGFPRLTAAGDEVEDDDASQWLTNKRTSAP